MAAGEVLKMIIGSFLHMNMYWEHFWYSNLRKFKTELLSHDVGRFMSNVNWRVPQGMGNVNEICIQKSFMRPMFGHVKVEDKSASCG